MLARLATPLAAAWLSLGAVGGGVGLAMAQAAAPAEMPDAQLRTYPKRIAFADARLDLETAIVNRGLVIDHVGSVGQMLDRTGKDVGSTRRIYLNAEYLSFCSAKLSRDMMEADATNAGFCPFVMFVYERADRAGEVVIGYRRPPAAGNAASRSAFAAIDAMLDSIAQEAVR